MTLNHAESYDTELLINRISITVSRYTPHVSHERVILPVGIITVTVVETCGPLVPPHAVPQALGDYGISPPNLGPSGAYGGKAVPVLN
jgi:hypothetical protein